MTQRQHKGEKRSETSQRHYRRSSRSDVGAKQTYQPKAGGGNSSTGLPAPSSIPPSASSSGPQFSSSSVPSSVFPHRSFKKSNGPNLEARTAVSSSDAESNSQYSSASANSSALGTSSRPTSDATAKPTNSSAQEKDQLVSGTSSPKPAPGISEGTAIKTTLNGESFAGVCLQFGSFSPGFVNGLQITARTSSAPPNLDEQKRTQTCKESSQSVPTCRTSASSSLEQGDDAEKLENRQQKPGGDPEKSDNNVQVIKDGSGQSISKLQLSAEDCKESSNTMKHLTDDMGQSKSALPQQRNNMEQSKDGLEQQMGGNEQSRNNATRAPVRRDVHGQVVVTPVASSTQNVSSLSIHAMPVTVPFQKPHPPIQFGIPRQPLQARELTPPPLQMPMPVTVANSAQVRNPAFVPGLQPHPLQIRGVMPQEQGVSFLPRFGPQLGSQFGNLGIGIPPQFAPRQPERYGPKRAVKITHPETHEELRLDEANMKLTGCSLGSASLHNISMQRQHFHYGPSPPSNYFPPRQPGPMSLQSSSTPIQNIQVHQDAPGLEYYTSGMSDFQNLATRVSIKPAISFTAEEASHYSNANNCGIDMTEIVRQPVKVTQPVESDISLETSVKHSTSGLEQSPFVISSLEIAPSTSISDVKILKTEVRRQKTSGAEEHDVTDAQPKKLDINDQLRYAQPEQTSDFVDNPVKVLNQVDGCPVNSGSPVKEAQSTAYPADTSTAVLEPGHSSYVDNNIMMRQATSTTSQTCMGMTLTAEPSPVDADAVFHSSLVHSIEGIQASGVLSVDDLANGDEVNKDATDRRNSDQDNHVTPATVVKDASEDIETGLSGQPCGGCDDSADNSTPLETAKQSKNDLKTPELALCCQFNALEVENSLAEEVLCTRNLVMDNKEKLAESSIGSVSQNDELMVYTAIIAGESNVDTISTPEASESKAGSAKSLEPSHFEAPFPDESSSTVSSKVEKNMHEKSKGNSSNVTSPRSKTKLASDLNKGKRSASRGKKKRREILQKADAAGESSDLYMAYKALNEKPQSSVSSPKAESKINNSAKLMSSSAYKRNAASSKECKQKSEVDNWEEADEVSIPKLVISKKDGAKVTKRRTYSRDFLLKFSSNFTTLPSSFDVSCDLVEALLSTKAGSPKHVNSESNGCPAQTLDTFSGVSRHDNVGTRVTDDEKKIKSPGSSASVSESHMEMSQESTGSGSRPVHGASNGSSKNHLGEVPSSRRNGLLSGTSQVGLQRSGPDADRWVRSSSFQKGLIPAPHAPLQVMHRAERKYEVRKVADAEEAKQRQLKAILNKLTPQNFDRLFEQVKEVNIDNATTLSGVIAQIFDKALMEPTFCEMYANFCHHLAGELPDFVEDDQKITFKRLLLNKCQEEFERGEREQAEADRVEEDGEAKQTDGEREEKRVQARRRMLGNIRLIGELYKMRMLTERIMHECIQKLLGQYQNPDEEDIECLCKLMITIGDMIDHPKAKDHMDVYFDMISKLSNNNKLSSRMRFMLMDVIDLRKNKWQQRRKVEGPKKIEEVHRDAVQERQAQATRLTRGPNAVPSTRKTQNTDVGHRVTSMVPDSGSQLGVYRGVPSQNRGFGPQDVRLEDRQVNDSRTVTIPPSRRSLDDDSINLSLHRGPTRTMSVRGAPMVASGPSPEVHPNIVESRRTSGPNGSIFVSDWLPYSSRYETSSRHGQDSSIRPSLGDHSKRSTHTNKEIYRANSFGRSTAHLAPLRKASGITNRASGNVLPEEHLHHMSITTIREFYSAVDENEVALCIREFNSPNFHPSMVSVWVNDSFERKDRDRDLLAGLLVNLNKSRGIVTTNELTEGFKSVLCSLDDAITDTPKAAQYLGHMLGRLIIDNSISLRDVAKLVRQGGEEPGSLIRNGLGYDIAASAFEFIRSKSGEPFLTDICRSSNVHLDDFRAVSTRK